MSERMKLERSGSALMGSIMEDKKKYAFSILFLAALMVATFYFVFRDVELGSVFYVFTQVDLRFVLLGFVLMLGYICCEATNIFVLTRSFGGKTHWFRCLKYAFVGFYFSAITPSSSGGQPAQIYYMQKDGQSIGKSSLGFIIMLASLELVTLLWGVVMFAIKGPFLLENISGIEPIFILGSVLYLLTILVLVSAVFSQRLLRRAAEGCIRLLCRLHLIRRREALLARVDRHLDEYAQAAQYIRKNPKLLLKVLATTTVQTFFQFSIPYTVYLAFDMWGFSFFDLFAMQAILTISVSSLPLPGAVGASESSFLTMFSVFFGQTLVLPAMLLTRVINFYFYLVVSGVVSMVCHVRMKRRELRAAEQKSSPQK